MVYHDTEVGESANRSHSRRIKFMKVKEPKAHVTVRINAETAAQLKSAVAKTGKRKSWIIEEALKEGVLKYMGAKGIR